jgi:hypothetical protein
MDTQSVVVAIGICVVVFGIGGFALGWSAGKRAYRDRMPPLDPEQLNDVDPEELEAVASEKRDVASPLKPDDEWDDE